MATTDVTKQFSKIVLFVAADKNTTNGELQNNKHATDNLSSKSATNRSFEADVFRRFSISSHGDSFREQKSVQK